MRRKADAKTNLIETHGSSVRAFQLSNVIEFSVNQSLSEIRRRFAIAWIRDLANGDRGQFSNWLAPSSPSPGKMARNFGIGIRLCVKGYARKGHANAAVAAAPACKNCLRLIINHLDKCTPSYE